MTGWEIIYFGVGGFLGYKFGKTIKKIIDRIIDSIKDGIQDIAEFLKKVF